MLAKNPGFSAVIVLTLALGIGANTAIFSLMDQVLLRPLPVRAPQELVVLDGPGIFTGDSEDHRRSRTRCTWRCGTAAAPRSAALVARYEAETTLGWRGRTERVNAEAVSGNYFGALGVAPALGRAFTPSDDRTPGAHPLVMLSHGFWTRRFGSDPALLGQTLAVNGQPMTIIGIAPAGFQGLEVGRAADVFVPITMRRTLTPTRDADVFLWRSRWLKLVGRLQPGVGAQQAKAAIDVVYRQALAEDIKTLAHYPPERRTEFLAKQIALTPGAAGFSELRAERDGASRRADGDGRPRPADRVRQRGEPADGPRHRAPEGGGHPPEPGRQPRPARPPAAGREPGAVAAGRRGRHAGRHLDRRPAAARAARSRAGRAVFSAEPDLRVGLFTLAVGVAHRPGVRPRPALQLTRPGVAGTLKDEAAAVVGGSGGRLRRGLVVAQVALSLLLLVGAGLFARSLQQPARARPRLRGRPPGRVLGEPARCPGTTRPRVQAFAVRVQEELRRAAGREERGTQHAAA